jgi:ferredoxin-type protein NapH
MMKLIRILGLGIFITAILVFIATLFIGNFQLSDAAIQKAFAGKETTVIQNFSKLAQENGVLNSVSNNPVSFINSISSLIEKYNEKTTNDIALKKGLTAIEIESILKDATANNQVNYSKAILEAIFKTQPEKTAIVDEATNWMYTASKKYDKIDDFKNDFNNKIGDINKANASEFIVYDNKYIRYDITKASSIGMVANNKGLFLFLTFGLGVLGSLMFIISALFLEPVAGIKNNGIYLQAATNRDG